MRKRSGLGFDSKIFKGVKWFQTSASSVQGLQSPFLVQDHVHIGTKLRNLLLKTGSNSNKLPFGKDRFIQVYHLKILLEKFSKDKHQLTASTFDSNDKQNFDSVLRICDKKVLNLLKEHVPKSEATIKFLNNHNKIQSKFLYTH